MKLHVIFTGRTTGRLFQEAIADYADRLTHYLPFSIEELPDLKNARNLSEEQQKEREADMLFEKLQPGDVLVLLDERGREFTSREFSQFIEQKMHTVPKRLVFLIGGPYGFAPRVYEAAQQKISLSKMTFSHQMVRLFLVEQIYRACTIMHGEPYHHD
ncbi:MAG: 23S rRNA (pseudouridine(1915)-N(3))-methyltransferase RlmH [Bacteroidales bacterium]|jgi:23S rRNA (pseudouridine1915-N3)-methyltransferase|nr:23S rRNA (pseudouridine(1915)-N(3))-methyltransferase RlmH [Bacteroidales bacterium]MBP5764415.1 23S rRNA (pseudouridine(1915)-N(3))-methyltransferase RlmH [Bacteroidales bacterium]